MSDPTEAEVQELAMLLDSFPAQDAAPAGVVVPIHPESRVKWAKALWKRGVRVHLDVAEEFGVPGDQPGMGMWNATRWVSREEYEAGTGPAPTPAGDTPLNGIAALLKLVDPNLLEQIESLDAEGAAEFKATLESKLPASVEALQQARKAMGVTAGELRGGGQLVAYVRADGTTTMVTPKQAAAYERRAKK